MKQRADEQTFDGISLDETILNVRRAYDGSFLKVDAVDVELPNGRQTTHEVLRHPGAVAIIALDDEERVLMVRQYRTALGRVVTEIPAGKLDPDETAQHCAHRELAEETGYRAKEMRCLAPIAPAAGYSDEIIHLFLASGLTPGEPHPDDNEFIACEWVPLAVLIHDVLAGRIADSKTVIAALLCDALKRRPAA
jgi:ADP-ribose pyrophosphatase